MSSTAAATDSRAKPPHLFWALTEGRAVFEFGSFIAMRALLGRLPKGDGHPVLVLPGFMAGDRSTLPMRDLLSDLGYDVHGWELGRNIRVDADRIQALADRLADIHAQSGKKVSIVGWSLGGVFARELAKMNPDQVRSVVTLGSPISDDVNHTFVRHLFTMINGDPSKIEIGVPQASRALPPPVPSTSILSKTDGVVAWRGSVQDVGPISENIEVYASHMGLGVNPSVMVALADRLAQAEGKWRPFKKEGWMALLFPTCALH
jgi:pimeloyl-ACP methyl ester carboxylesterase